MVRTISAAAMMKDPDLPRADALIDSLKALAREFLERSPFAVGILPAVTIGERLQPKCEGVCAYAWRGIRIVRDRSGDLTRAPDFVRVG